VHTTTAHGTSALPFRPTAPIASGPPAAPRRVTHLGLTGGIGSGKSTVAQLLVDCGAALVDTDAIARALTLPGGAAIPGVAAEFGPAMIGPDGAMDRARMRTLVFADAGAKQRLEALLHPLIGQQAQALAANAEAAGLTVVFDVPLLSETSHWRARVQRVLVVDCSEDTQVRRVIQRSGWSPEMAQQVVQQQLSRMARRRMADAVLHNDGIGLDELQHQVQALWQRWALTA
jgi:dephospho-CoA kinase